MRSRTPSAATTCKSRHAVPNWAQWRVRILRLQTAATKEETREHTPAPASGLG